MNNKSKSQADVAISSKALYLNRWLYKKMKKGGDLDSKQAIPPLQEKDPTTSHPSSQKPISFI